ncbi:MAG: UvrD-helicase domain-containing protein [Gammaproteobacteria bacterium (ex Lamellibrachia satsuma)]|nr:MAG: UvrD-helicase domain-containing protein [Gammaproteobacteria bacterium (ex Lamellibrachia satsuma)]
MQFRIADSFTKALGKLNAQEQSATKITVFDLQQDSSAPGLKFHRIDKSKDPNFWSVRSNRDIRVIVHKTAASFLICYVDHHDDAYKWAERRRIETHPKTGAAQIVEVRERVEEIAAPVYVIPEPQVVTTNSIPPEIPQLPLFSDLSEKDLLGVGVPQDWVTDVLQSSEDLFFELTDHIPAEAAEALLDYVTTGVLRQPEVAIVGESPFDHPDAQRRFRVLEDVEELERALEYPWDQWAIFLHPSQRRVVEQEFSGPARVSGSAGTGKTVVALHRAAAILKKDKQAKVLLTTFSSPLANALEHKLQMLTGKSGSDGSLVTILPFEGVAYDLFTLAFGHTPRAATRKHVRGALETAVKELGLSGFTLRFLVSEWNNVIDAWQIDTLDAYRDVPRLGRKNRMGSKQRERVWPVFVRVRELLEAQGLNSWSGIFGKVTAHYAVREHKPFTHIIVDEAQDLGVPELRLLAAIADQSPAALFFAGDLGQQIFQEPFSWKGLGVDIRGRSQTLTVNYRTSHQIRQTVDRLLPPLVRDVDGIEEDRRGTVSVFNGPDPDVKISDDSNQENKGVVLWIDAVIDEGIEPEEIGIFVRSNNELHRARAVVKLAGQTPLELSDRVESRDGRVSIGTMHLAKGLEFKAVVVMACDDDILPLQKRIENVADESELDDVYETERHLFYVACTRARDRLLVTGVGPASEFFEDIKES